MRIAHAAIWALDLEAMKQFYVTYFGGKPNEKYVNPAKQFSSYFIKFDGDAALELMHSPHVLESLSKGPFAGLAHLAISVGSKEAVERITRQIANDGYKVVGDPRTTGDGYYESVIEDPEENLIEITI